MPIDCFTSEPLRRSIPGPSALLTLQEANERIDVLTLHLADLIDLLEERFYKVEQDLTDICDRF